MEGTSFSLKRSCIYGGDIPCRALNTSVASILCHLINTDGLTVVYHVHIATLVHVGIVVHGAPFGKYRYLIDFCCSCCSFWEISVLDRLIVVLVAPLGNIGT